MKLKGVYLHHRFGSTYNNSLGTSPGSIAHDFYYGRASELREYKEYPGYWHAAAPTGTVYIDMFRIKGWYAQ